MIQRTISAMVGKGSINHNCRKFTAENVDPSRSHLKSSRRILVFSNMSQPAGFSACFFILCSQGIFHMSVQGVQSPLPFPYSAGLRGRSYTGTADIDSCA